MDPTSGGVENRNSAAVGIIYSSGEIILIKRNEREDDPWTGQIALPGGFSKFGEQPEETVLREVMEEVNMSFTKESIYAELHTNSPNKANWIKVHPFVLKTRSLEGFKAGPEVSEVRRVKLSGRIESRTENGYDSFVFQDWIVWGLTYRILKDFIEMEKEFS